MEKLNLPFFYQLGHQLTALANLRPSEVPVAGLVVACVLLDPTLKLLLGFSPLRVARPACEELRSLVDGLSSNLRSQTYGQVDFTKPVDSRGLQLQSDVITIVRKALDFQTVLNAELQSLTAYVVTGTGIYAVPDLVVNAENVIPVGLREKLSKVALEEIKQSGRCLAFGIGTASGFHILRATEAVMHQYYTKVCNQEVQCEPLENWGAYIAQFRKTNDSDTKRIGEMLQQVKDHDRNLIMHPEISLNEEEALTLFEVAKGAIFAMAEKL